MIDEWEGEPTVMEPDKCDRFDWFPLDALPAEETLFVPIVNLLKESSFEALAPHPAE